MLPDASGAEPLIPLLEDVVGAEVTLRASVPKALSNVPRVRVVLDRLRAFLG